MPCPTGRSILAHWFNLRGRPELPDGDLRAARAVHEWRRQLPAAWPRSATYGIPVTREVPTAVGAMTGEELLADSQSGAVARCAAPLAAALQALRALLATHGCVLEGGVDGTEDTPLNADTMESRSRLHGNSCDPGHVLVLARSSAGRSSALAASVGGEVRDADGKSFSSYAAKGERMSGVYLPCLLDPSECSRDPLTIIYTSGHFSALVASEMASSVEGGALWPGRPSRGGDRQRRADPARRRRSTRSSSSRPPRPRLPLTQPPPP